MEYHAVNEENIEYIFCNEVLHLCIAAYIHFTLILSFAALGNIDENIFSERLSESAVGCENIN